MAISIFGALGFNWSDLSHSVSLPRFYFAIFASGPTVLVMILMQTVVSVKLPPAHQVASQAYLQMMGQFGRGLGPIAATTYYDWFTKANGLSGGYNAASSFLMIWTALGYLPPLFGFKTIFGDFDAPSYAQMAAAAAAKKAKEMM